MSGICGVYDPSGAGDASLAETLLDPVRPRGGGREAVHRAGPALLAVTERPRPDPPGETPLGRAGDIVIVTDGYFSPPQTPDGIAAARRDGGDDFLEPLDGGYALAVYDSATRRLTLATDRTGSKPLYYARAGERFLFSSSLRSLLAAGVSADFEPQAVHAYLALGFVPGPGTIFRSIRKLGPARLLTVGPDGEQSERPYWDPLAAPRERPSDLRERAEELWRLIADAGDRFAPRDEPIGLLLSAGPDAAAVLAALADRDGRRIETFTAVFDSASYDESAGARETAQRFGVSHHEVRVGPPGPDELLACQAAFDEPHGHPSAVALYALGRAVAPYARVSIGGEGADDPLSGSNTVIAAGILEKYNRLPGFLARGLIPWAVRRLPLSYSQSSLSYRARRFVEAAGLPPEQAEAVWKRVLPADLHASLLGPRLREAELSNPFEGFYQRYQSARELHFLDRLYHASLSGPLGFNVLAKHDRLPAAFGVENRSPFIARELVEFCFGLPPRDKVRGLSNKILLRRALEGRVPQRAIEQPKAPFNSPSGEWLAGDLGASLRDILSASKLREQGWLEPAAVERLIADHAARRSDYGPALWSLLSFTLWVDSLSD